MGAAAALTLVIGCSSAPEAAETASDSALTQDQLTASLVAQGYVDKGKELYKVQYIHSEHDAPSGMICILNNSTWAFGRNCYFVYETIVEDRTVETYGERFEHPDGRIAYALDGIQIGPFKLGPHPIVGKWSRRTDGLDPSWQCDGWSNFSVDVLDFRLDNGVRVHLNVSGGRFPVAYAPEVESQLFGVDQDVGSYDVTSEQVVLDKQASAGSDTGSMKLAIRAGGKFRLSLSYTRAAATSGPVPSFGLTTQYEGIDQDDNCPIVECDAANGSRVVAPTTAPLDVDGAKVQCGPFRTQSGVPAFLLPAWDPSRHACTFDKALLAYRLAELEPSVNPYAFCGKGLLDRAAFRVALSDVSAPTTPGGGPVIGKAQPENLDYENNYVFVECKDDEPRFSPSLWINGHGTPIRYVTLDHREFGSLTENATCKPLRVE